MMRRDSLFLLLLTKKRNFLGHLLLNFFLLFLLLVDRVEENKTTTAINKNKTALHNKRSFCCCICSSLWLTFSQQWRQVWDNQDGGFQCLPCFCAYNLVMDSSSSSSLRTEEHNEADSIFNLVSKRCHDGPFRRRIPSFPSRLFFFLLVFVFVLMAKEKCCHNVQKREKIKERTNAK